MAGTGDEGLSERRERKSRSASDALPTAESDGKTTMPGNDSVGKALRRAFQSAVNEDVPQEMLDLLRRLG